jgi:hypothetical protein
MKRLVNPFVKWILRSPAHRLLSSHLLLISVTGRRSGRDYEIPVAYHQSGNLATIDVGAPERKQWWRNFRHRRPTRVIIRGDERPGWAMARTDETGTAVTVELSPSSEDVEFGGTLVAPAKAGA